MKYRRRLIQSAVVLAGSALAGLPSAISAPVAAAGAKVFRYAFPAAETGFDPAKVSDLYSRTVTAHIFEGLYGYDPLARPFKVVPRTAVGMPEVSPDYKTWTVRIKPGITFADDPAFKGQPRELVAQDFVYSIKRFADPAVKSPAFSEVKDQGLVGLLELREQALKSKQPFDYDRDIEGLRALDRYTVQFRLAEARPRFLYFLAAGGLYGALAREVVQAYGDKIDEHPVGTGPFVLTSWRRSSRIVLERNPSYREVFYDASPNDDDAEGQALLARFKGRRLPMIDRVEVSIIDESQPRWLAFLNRQLDFVTVPLEFANLAAPNGVLAPNLAKQGIQMSRIVNADTTLTYFNMEDPLVGGLAPEKVALRRAIALASDPQREIDIVRRGQAIAAQSGLPPHTYGYDPALKSVNSDYDLARAKALLDVYGYVDRDGDGWRERPDGSLLVLEYATQPDAITRQFDEMWRKNMDALGLRLTFKHAQWPEQLKAARAGKLMIWQVGSTAGTPDGQDALQRVYSPAAGGQNLARFKLARVDAIYEQMAGLPDGAQRLALFTEMNKLITAYMPYRYNVHRIVTDLMQPWLTGYRRPLFWQDFWQTIDIDHALRPRQ
jgi:ABC-type transport system substrate-binding protein